MSKVHEVFPLVIYQGILIVMRSSNNILGNLNSIGLMDMRMKVLRTQDVSFTWKTVGMRCSLTL